jgi:hypothetical protein
MLLSVASQDFHRQGCDLGLEISDPLTSRRSLQAIISFSGAYGLSGSAPSGAGSAGFGNAGDVGLCDVLDRLPPVKGVPVIFTGREALVGQRHR